MSHFQTAGQAAYSISKPATMALPNKWTEQKRVQIIRYKKFCRFKKKRTLSRGATGWMLHFNVRNTNCLLNNMSFGIGLEKVGHIFQGNIYRSVDIMWPAFSSPIPKDMLLRRQMVLRTLKWSIQPVAPRLKSPSFESARFFVSYNFYYSCLLQIWSTWVFVIVLSGVAGGGVCMVSEEGRGSGGCAPGKIFHFPPRNNGVL